MDHSCGNSKTPHQPGGAGCEAQPTVHCLGVVPSNGMGDEKEKTFATALMSCHTPGRELPMWNLTFAATEPVAPLTPGKKSDKTLAFP